MELQLPDKAESIQHVNIASILANTDNTAHIGKSPDSIHPDPVVLAPENLISRTPVPVVGTVIGWIRLKIFFDSWMEIFLEPRLVHGSHQVTVGLVDD